MKLLLVVAAALLDGNGRVLVAQRPPGKSLAGLWEFPGGKIEADERPEDALARELAEELGISIDVNKLEPLTFASHAYPEAHLLMPLYCCRDWVGQPVALEGQALRWVTSADLAGLAMPPADAPLLAALLPLLTGAGATES